MTRFRLPAALAVLALTAGCIVPTDRNDPAKSIIAEVTITTLGRGAADTVLVDASFFGIEGGERIRFSNDTLRVQNVTGQRFPEGRRAAFFARLPLDSAAVQQGLRVRLPVPTLGPVPNTDFTLFSAARRGSPNVTLRAGQDLSLPVVRGTSGSLPDLEFEHWAVSFSRGGRSTTISGNGPLPSPVIIPWPLIPRDGGEVMNVFVTSHRRFSTGRPGGAIRPDGQGRLATSISANAQLEWTVRIVP